MSDLAVFKKTLTDSKSTELHVISYESGYLSPNLQTRTALHETDSLFSFGIGSNSDLVLIRRSGTGSYFTEVQIVSASSNYHSVANYTSILNEADGSIDLLVASNNDIFAIRKSCTKSGRLELSILAASSSYRSYSLQVILPIDSDNGTYSFAISPNHDLFVFKHTGENLADVQISILTVVSNYENFRISNLPSALITAGEPSKYYTFCIASNNDIYSIKKYGTSTKFTEIRIIDSSTDYTSIKHHTRTVLPETDSSFFFHLNPNNDLMVIKSRRTASRKIEIMKLSPSSDFGIVQQHISTSMYQHSSPFAFLTKPNSRDVVIIKKLGTDSRSTEILILSSTDNYEEYSLKAVSALPETDESYVFSMGYNGDIYAIKQYDNPSGKTVLTILSSESNYKSISRTVDTALHETDHNYGFTIAPNNDLFVFKKKGSSNSSEVHILSASSNYQSFCLQVAIPIPISDESYTFLLNTLRDVFVIKKQFTSSRKTEITKLTATSNYQKIEHTIKSYFPETDSSYEFSFFNHESEIGEGEGSQDTRSEGKDGRYEDDKDGKSNNDKEDQEDSKKEDKESKEEYSESK